jgi:uncharacterized Zn-binding protein involved in type VI secretion
MHRLNALNPRDRPPSRPKLWHLDGGPPDRECDEIMPEAARISDMHTCPKDEPGHDPHMGGPVFAGSANVLIGYLPAARVGDAMVCSPVGPSDRIKAGAATVLINYCGAARRTRHRGTRPRGRTCARQVSA